jgi:hypothetical protein
MITRDDIITNARGFLNAISWSPSVDTYVFNPSDPSRTFNSAFVAQLPSTTASVPAEYSVIPYVFGGGDSKTTFLSRIQANACPGGWDRTSGNGTKHWYDAPPNGFGYGDTTAKNLAGIDCSGYVSRCWGFTGTRYSTQSLEDISMEIAPSQLQPGDILNWRGHHVRIFFEWASTNRTNGPLKLYEAAGGGLQRAFQATDEAGRVVFHQVAWDSRYLARTPFPLLTETEPAPGSYTLADPPSRTITAKIAGKGGVDVAEVAINRRTVPFSARSFADGVEVTHDEPKNWAAGSHEVLIKAVNGVAGQTFKNDLIWEFSVT